MNHLTWTLLTLVYLAPLALLGLLLSHGRRHPRWLLATLLAALPLFYIAHYQLLNAIQGWPSDAPVPDEFHLIGFHVSEPDGAAPHEGEILLWVRDAAGGQTRVHRLDYSQSLHQSLVDAGRLQAQGQPQLGTRQQPESLDTQDRPATTQPSIRFSTAQRTSLPAKETEP